MLYSSSFSHKRIDVLAWRPADKALIAVDLKTRFSTPVTEVRDSETAGLQDVHRLAVEQLLRVDGLPAQRLESWLFMVDAERVAWFGQDDLGGELVTERCPS